MDTGVLVAGTRNSRGQPIVYRRAGPADLSPDPVAGATAVLRDSKNKVLGTGVTGADGWYTISYKYMGKAATFYVPLTPPSGTAQTKTITLKANAFIQVDFLVP